MTSGGRGLDVGLDVAWIRGQFPGLSDGYVHAEGPGGALVPESVTHAVAQAMRMPLSAPGAVYPASHRAAQLTAAARSAVADLVGGVPGGVVLGPNMTTLTYTVARALARTWGRGDEIVVSRLDHDANIRPWLQLAERYGVVVRWAEVDIETGELPDWQYDELVTDRTRLVAVTAASSAVGTRPDVAAIAARAHRVGALVYVDAVHAAAHSFIDMDRMGADLLAVSAYKWCGPHIAAVVADPQLWAQLEPEKLVPSPDWVPERFEHGDPSTEMFAGLVAAVDHLAELCPGAVGSRRDKLATSMGAVARYEGELFTTLDDALREMRHVYVLADPEFRTPTLSFTIARMRARTVARDLSRRGIAARDGDHYASELFDALGVSEAGGAVRLGLMHYNTADEVDRLIEAIADLR